MTGAATMSTRTSRSIGVILGCIALSASSLVGCRSKDNCYKTYPHTDSPTERAMNPDDESPEIEHAPAGPTAQTLPRPSNPNAAPR